MKVYCPKCGVELDTTVVVKTILVHGSFLTVDFKSVIDHECPDPTKDNQKTAHGSYFDAQGRFVRGGVGI
jgi:hypothetical protein